MASFPMVSIMFACCVFISSLPASAAQTADAYEHFNKFCIERFGAEKEPLTYAAFGKDLKFIADGDWLYPSETSACVAFETSLPAQARVEYGLTDKYGSKTSPVGKKPAERNFYIHVRYLTGLEPGKTYHYRFVAKDERGNVIKSPDKTFTTALPAGTKPVRIPDDLDGPPYVLNKSGAYYLVTKDMTVDGTAFDVPQKVRNITLDLGGHTVVYNNKKFPTIKSGNFGDWIRQAKYGLRAMKTDGLKVYNGTIKQGAGQNAAQANSIGYNPMYLNGGGNRDIGGVTIDYGGVQQAGIYCHWGGNNSRYHHNVFMDRGTKLINRHGAGCRSILPFGGDTKGMKVDHNLVKRTRQSGLSGNEVLDNEVYVDSWTTNSFGIRLMAGGLARGNKVMGTGYHVVAFGWGTKLTFKDNFIHLEGMPKTGRFKEFGNQISLNGFRLTQYNGSRNKYADNLYEGNTIAIRARDACQGRGVQFFSDPYVTGLKFRNNVVKAVAADRQTKQVACVVTQGLPKRTDQQAPIIYEGDTFISNICNIRFGDYYGVGSNHRFYNCKFVRIGDDPRYKTFLWDTGYPCKNHVIRDATFVGGASLDSIKFSGDDQDMTVEWTVTVKTAPAAEVTITDRTGKQVFSGRADAAGELSAALAQYKATIKGKTVYTPHTITVRKDGKTVSMKVDVTGKQTVDVAIK